MTFTVRLSSDRRITLQRLAVSLLFLSVVIATLGQVIVSSFHGLDISDEGMYLLSAERLTSQSSFHNPFGDYTGLLYRASLRQVWAFRVLGIIVLGLVGAVLSRSIHRMMRESTHSYELLFTLAGTLVVPYYYAIGLDTPSYNWLNLASLCLGLASIISLIDTTRNDSRRTIILWSACFACSMWIGTFAKVSTGPGLLVLLLFAFLCSKPSVSSARLVVASTTTTVLVLAVFHSLALSSLSTVISKIARGQKALTVLDPRYDLGVVISDFFRGTGKWLGFTLGPYIPLFLASIVLSLYIAIVRRTSNPNLLPVRLVSVLVCGVTVALFVKSYSDNLWSGNYGNYGSQVRAVSSIIAAVLISSPLLIACRPLPSQKKHLLVPLLLFGGVALYGFGSNNQFVEQITGAAGLLALTAISLALFLTRSNLLAITAAFLLVLGGLLTTIDQKNSPYRQAPQSEQTVRIEIKSGGGSLFLDPRLARNIFSLRAQLRKSPWIPGTPILDFTQYSAGIVFALEGKPPITIIPTVGGMANVDALAKWSLDFIAKHQLRNEWSNAWLLLPNPTTGVECIMCPSTATLSKLNRNFPAEYERVASSQDFEIFRPKFSK